MGYFEWSKSDVERIINDSIQKGEKGVSLSMDKNTYENEVQVVNWAKELGHEVKHEMERVVVTFS
jgi:hypothetical protein